MQLCTVQAGKSVSPRPSSSSRPYSDERPARLQHLLHLLDSGVDKGLQPSRLQLLMAETPGGCTPCRLAKESCPGPHARDDATSGRDSNVLRLSSDLIGPVEPRGYDGTRYLIGFTKEFINWLDMQDFKDQHTTRRLHLDNDTFIQDHEL